MREIDDQAISRSIQNHLGDIVELRRNLHSHPELSWEELRTTERLRQAMADSGLTLREVPVGTSTGFVCDVGEGGPTVAIRADIDALPITETSGAPYASRVDGVAHSCGHDFHAACLVGAARVLADLNFEASGIGTIRFVFQPAEEAGDGAPTLISGGVLRASPAVDMMVGYHVDPKLPAGSFSVREGAVLAACDIFDILVEGRGGHAAMPELAVDSNLVAAEVLIGLQSIVSRRIPASESAVLTVGKVAGGSSRWAIPDQVTLEGTFRSHSEQTRNLLQAEIELVASSVARAHRAKATASFQSVAPALLNDSWSAKQLMGIVTDRFGTEAFREAPLQMISDDFSFYTREVRSCYFFTGVGFEDVNRSFSLHHPSFDIDERAIEPTVEVIVRYLLKLCEQLSRGESTTDVLRGRLQWPAADRG